MNRRRLPADTGLPAQLAAAADAVEEYRGGGEAEVERRNELMVKAIAAGYTYRQVAKMARVSTRTVVRAVLAYEPDAPAADPGE